MNKILILPLAVLLLCACKKNKSSETITAPPVPESPAETQRKADSTFNSKLVTGLGNIYQQTSYTSLQNDVPVYKFLQGKDTIYYYGKTDASGNVAQVNGYRLCTSAGKIIRLELNRNDSSIILHDQFADTSKPVLALEIKHKSDSLISISVYRVGSGIKTLLYERLKRNTQPVFRSGGTDSASVQSKITGVKDLFKDAGDWITDQLNNTQLAQLLAEIEHNSAVANDRITPNEAADLYKIFGESLIATNFTLAEYYQKLGEIKVTNGSVTDENLSLDAKFRKWFYEKYGFKFSFVAVGGFEQSITYGKTPNPFKAILYYEGAPFKTAKVIVTQLYRGKSKSDILTTNEFGIAEYTPDAVDVEDDQYGPGKMEVTFEKFNEESKTLFTVNLKPRLRVHLEYIFGDNQVAFVGETLAKPLIIQAEDEDGHPAPGLKIYWEDLTPGIASSGFATQYTETQSDGKSSNTWKMQTKEGSHLAKVTFVHIKTEDYIMEAGSKVLFLAEAKLDDLTILRSKTWSLINGPIKNYTTINNQNCSNILTVPSYELQSATLSFQLVNGVTQAVETRGGLCQAQCGNYQLFFGNPCTVVLGNATAENYSNSILVNGISNGVFQLSNFSPAIPGGGLPWLLYGAKIVSLDSRRLVLTSTFGYYSQQLIFE